VGVTRLAGRIIIENLYVQYVLTLLSCAFIAKIISLSGWGSYTVVYHAVIETICVLIGVMIAVLVWCTYTHIPPENCILGFGFMTTAVLGVFHTCYFSGLTESETGLSMIFAVVVRLAEALVLLAVSFNIFSRKIDRRYGLFFSLVFAFTLSWLIKYFYVKLPGALFFEPFSTERVLTELVIAGIFVLSILKIKDSVNNRDMLTYRCIYMAMLAGIAVTICSVLSKGIASYFFIMQHLMKVSLYCWLFEGVFVSALNYPYEMMEKTSKYMYEIFNVMPVALSTYDPNLRLNFVNKKITEMLGYKEEEILGLSVDEIEEKVYCNETYRKHVIKEIVGSSLHTLQNKVRTFKAKNGEKTRVLIDVYRLENGGFLCLFDEVKRAQTLENLQLQTKTILNAVNNLIVVTDKNNVIIMCNEAFMNVVEMDKQDLLGMKLDDLYNILKMDRKEARQTMSLWGEKQGLLEASFTTLNGNKKEVLLFISPIYNMDGEVIGGISAASDVTLFKREYETMRQQEKLVLLGQMAAGIVHEVRNPLTTILGFSQIIALKTQEQCIVEYARLIENEVHGLNKVVSDFLAFAKPQPPVFNETSLNNLVKSMELMLETHLFTKNIKSSFNLTDNEKTVRVDANQVKQVILNIVQNATEALQGTENPQIIISTGFSGTYNEMYLEIYNNGRAMTREEKSKVGTPFFTTKARGTGLGMSICFQIIKEHGGRIEIESEPDLGTTFILSFPVYKPVSQVS